MMKHSLLALTAALIAGPVLAQTPPLPPPPLVSPGLSSERPMPNERRMMMRRDRMFGDVSPEGRATLMAALRPADAGATQDAISAARGRVADLLAADRLDVSALRRAMDEERRLVDAKESRRQAAMLDAFQKLSVADRKAFAADARLGRDRMARRMGQLRHYQMDRRGPATGGRGLTPAPDPSAPPGI